MATKRIETLLSIKAIDQYSNTLRNMRTATGRFADGVRTELSSLQGIRGPLRLIEDFRKQQDVVRKSGAAMEQAREKQRRLLAEIRATNNPTAQMRREFDRARTAADRLEQQHHQNRRTLSGLRGQMRSADINTADLAGEQRRLAGSVDRVTTSIGSQIDRLRRLETMQTRIAEGRERMDRSLATASNVAITGFASIHSGKRILTALSGPVQQAVEFESAMSDVRKVVDFDTPEAFSGMSEDILELSTRIPMAADGLAQIVAAGGQSGIAREELLRFAETAAKIGVAFDISAGQSGDAMASIKTQLGLTVDQTSSLFDAINHLSNNMASTAPKVLDFTTRVAADGEVKGFNATETIAFGSAMIAAGVGADVAATSFRNMGKALARGAASTPKQRAAFESLGLSAADVAKRMQEDAVGTTLNVMERINQLPAHLQSSTMSQIFGDEARAITPLINRLDLLRDALGLVSDEQQYLGSAEAEYAERAKTTANNLQLMRNQMSRLGISIGEVVLPPLNDLLEMSQGVIDRMVEWTKENPKLTKGLVIGATAFGAMAVAGGAVLNVAGGLIGTMAVLRFGFVGLGARAAYAAGDLMGVGRVFKGLTRLPKFALSTLLTPVLWTSRLVSKLPWARLAGRLAISTLITPLRWTAALLPSFAPALLRFSNFRSDASGEITRLSTHVGRESAAMQKSLSRVRWGALSAGAMTFLAMRAVPENPEDLAEFQQNNVETMDRTLRATPGISHLIEGYEKAFEWVHGKPPPAATEGPASADNQEDQVAVLERVKDLRKEAEAYRLELEAAQAALDSAPEFESGIINPSRVQAQGELTAAQARLRDVEDKLKAAEKAASSVAGGNRVKPEAATEPDRKVFGVQVSARPLERPVQTLLSPAASARPISRSDREIAESAAATLRTVGETHLPTPARLQELRDHAASLREEIANIQGEIDNLGQGPMADTMAIPLRQDMDARRRELQGVETELSSAEKRADDLTSALQILDGTEATPEISTASIDRANEKVARLLAQLRAIPSAGTGSVASPKPAGARALGGPVRSGLPYLVNENTPRSEWFVPSQSGGILNVSQAQSALRAHMTSMSFRPIPTNPSLTRLHRGAQGLRAASLAVLTSSAVAMPAAAQSAAPVKPGSSSVTVQIENFTVQVPSGVSDPEAIADLVSERIGQRVSATLTASFSD
ncbi:phage tail tape measure protein [Sulfitobacter faviae]|uniref:Phage tail tape measure protein n=1 Tax=Sulfitobacter faviae TaxID=1775881 RepID=A0ABZ0V6R1_9RHOB|nr:phage tail tape measure protein [Sulfitobacter faviae]WPZ23095.1 phage tail tape measure protein [Sulfitobacter faviae]